MNNKLNLILIALATLTPFGVGAQDNLAGDLVVVSSAASPRVAYGITHKKDVLEVVISVASFDSTAKDSGIGLQVGLAADTVVMLSEKDARVRKVEGNTEYEFKVPDKKLVTGKEGLDRLRMGLAVNWPGGPGGEARQRETFLQRTTRSPHAGLGSAEDWQAINLAEFEKMIADRHLQIAFDFSQPMEGKATLVIEDEKGNRVRNLVSGQTMSKGKQRIVWDATNDKGDLMPPGKYQWRALSHPGLKPNYLFSFCDGPGSNHGTFHSAATNGKDLFFGTSVSEGGYELVQLDVNGKMIRGYNSPMGHGLGRVAVTADDQYLYAAYDGSSWGQHVERSKPDWKADYKISLVRFDLGSGNVANFGKSAYAEVRLYTVGPGSPDKRPDQLGLSGLAIMNGRLYLGDATTNSILEIDPVTGVVARSFPLENPVDLAAGKDGLYVLAGQRLLQMDPTKGEIRKAIATLEGRPTGLAVGSDGKFYVSDAKSDVVRVLDGGGKSVGMPVGMIGKPGGIKIGPYDPLQFHNPAGLTMSPDGHLWVTESDRWTPKRLAAFDVRSGTIWKEFFGPTAYGASNSGFDPADSTHWIGQGTLFKLDFQNKSATPLANLGGEEGRTYRFWRQAGRTFVIACGKVTYIEELLPNNTLKPLAFLSSGHQYSYAHDWNPPAEFVEAFQRDYPAQKYVPGVSGRPNHGFGMIWLDKNGDGKMQAEEIEFSTNAENLAGSGWGHDLNDLTLRVPAMVKGKSVLVTLKPDGWWPGGAPKYPSLKDAVNAAVPIDLPSSTMAETTVDRFGNTLVNSDPVMRAWTPDGHLLWTYPNRWSNVHGSHDAPLPSTGELQGVLFFTGVAPLDDKADVVAMNGNHGRAFFMTSDGLYIDELFQDVRLMTNPQAGGVGILGGECFGGTFGRSQKDGNYYYQGGGIEYRIYRVDGLCEVVRNGGSLTVTADQVVAAERNKSRVVAAEAKPHSARIPWRKTAPVIDGKGDDWPGEPVAQGVAPSVAQWNKSNQFPVTVWAAHDDKMLFLYYSVKDGSPWVNNGKDWQLLFKTGDGIDLQLGTDPASNPKRSGPVPGDLRLLVAPFQGSNIAVLYRHRLKGAADSVVFQSPWRSEKVDSVKKLESAQIAVTRNGDTYNVEVAVPLSELGLKASSVGKLLRADFGVIYGDAAGTTNIFRNYWSNQSTGLVNDVPGEIMLSPNLWGDVMLEVAP